jgi:hypothetical protein
MLQRGVEEKQSSSGPSTGKAHAEPHEAKATHQAKASQEPSTYNRNEAAQAQHCTNKHNKGTGTRNYSRQDRTTTSAEGWDGPHKMGSTKGARGRIQARRTQGCVAASKGNSELPTSTRDERSPRQARPTRQHCVVGQGP